MLRGAGGRVICARCIVAATAWRRLRGLLGRQGLEPSEGLLLVPAASIHTAFMRMAIDVVFVGHGGEVLRVVPAVGPWRIAACRGARAVLELPAGACRRLGLAAGEQLDGRFQTSRTRG